MGDKPVATEKPVDDAAKQPTYREVSPERSSRLIDVWGNAAHEVGKNRNYASCKRNIASGLGQHYDTKGGYRSKIMGSASHMWLPMVTHSLVAEINITGIITLTRGRCDLAALRFRWYQGWGCELTIVKGCIESALGQ